LFFENHTVYEVTCKNIVDPDRPQTTLWRMHIACWIPMATNTIRNNYRFSTATMVARTRLYVTLYKHCVSC